METFHVHCTLYQATFAGDFNQSKIRTRIRWAEHVSKPVLHVLTGCGAGQNATQRPTTQIPTAFETMQVSLALPDMRNQWLIDNELMRILHRLVRLNLHINGF